MCPTGRAKDTDADEADPDAYTDTDGQPGEARRTLLPQGSGRLFAPGEGAGCGARVGCSPRRRGGVRGAGRVFAPGERGP